MKERAARGGPGRTRNKILAGSFFAGSIIRVRHIMYICSGRKGDEAEERNTETNTNTPLRITEHGEGTQVDRARMGCGYAHESREGAKGSERRGRKQEEQPRRKVDQEPALSKSLERKNGKSKKELQIG